jgi:hypothetical protein
MTLLGTLLKNRRAGETHLAWNLQNLYAPELLSVRSEDFDEGEPIPLPHAGKRIGGDNLSPRLTWGQPPPETTDLLLVVEDIDAPIPSPPSIALHALTRPDSAHPSTCRRVPSQERILPLASECFARASGVATTALSRSRGHGPHRYAFQLFALSSGPDQVLHGPVAGRTRPRAYLASITAPVPPAAP